jgi:hypothetical protein
VKQPSTSTSLIPNLCCCAAGSCVPAVARACSYQLVVSRLQLLLLVLVELLLLLQLLQQHTEAAYSAGLVQHLMHACSKALLSC